MKKVSIFPNSLKSDIHLQAVCLHVISLCILIICFASSFGSSLQANFKQLASSLQAVCKQFASSLHACYLIGYFDHLLLRDSCSMSQIAWFYYGIMSQLLYFLVFSSFKDLGISPGLNFPLLKYKPTLAH